MVFDLADSAAAHYLDQPDKPYAPLGRWAHTLGFRGHFSTRSRRYSVTLTRLRLARRRWQHLLAESKRTGVPIDVAHIEAQLLAADEDTTLVVGQWTYIGTGWANEGDTALARAAADRAREYAQDQAARKRAAQSAPTGDPVRGEGAVDEPPDVQPPTLLTVDQAAGWCRITRHTLNHLRLHGRFAPAIKIGRRCFWTPDDLNAWIASQREQIRCS